MILLPISDRFSFGTGVKARYKLLQDKNVPDFNYTEEIFAAYGTLGYKQTKFNVDLGGRIEKSLAVLENNFSNPVLSFFPHFNFTFKITSRQNIQLAYNRSIIRPNIYQLNPFITIDDPYTVSKGSNPFLNAESAQQSLFGSFHPV